MELKMDTKAELKELYNKKLHSFFESEFAGKNITTAIDATFKESIVKLLKTQIKIPLVPDLLFKGFLLPSFKRRQVRPIPDLINNLDRLLIGRTIGQYLSLRIHKHHIRQSINRPIQERFSGIINSLLIKELKNIIPFKIHKVQLRSSR